MTSLSAVPDIMEVTLRDGSYVIDFQFTAEDTANLVNALESAGFRWIEIGHGLGLNAQDKGKRRAVASDEEHLIAASKAVKTAKWGMFFIPNIGRAEDIDLAAKYDMDFIRIGTNVTESEKAKPFIEQAKSHGMFTCYNAMKSYAVSPQEFAQVAKQTQSWGADMVYIVDSAGTMLPEDVDDFIKAIKAVCDVPIGFHGHDNLSMGMANTLQAIESGASIVDSSLRGMGRSAGNVITEALLAILQRRGYLADIDLKAVMDVSAGMIAPLVPGRGLDTMAITAGLAGFHSSFTAKVKSYAEQFDIDVRDLIVKLCEQNRVDAPDELLEQLSKTIARNKQAQHINIPAFQAREDDNEETAQTLPTLFKRLYSDAQKHQTYTALNIVLSQTLQDDYTVSQHIHSTPTHTIGSVSFSTETHLVDILDQADGNVDVVLLDIDRRRIFGPQMAALTASDVLQNSQLLVYSDSRAWSEAVKDQVVRLLDEQIQNAKVVIAGEHPRSRLLALMLMDYGADVTVIIRDAREEDEYAQAAHMFSQTDYPHDNYVEFNHAASALEQAQVVVVWPSWGTWFDETLAQSLIPDTYLLDAGIGSIESSGITEARNRGALPIRINIWPTLAGILVSAHIGSQTQPQRGIFNTVPIVSGGAIGERGAIVVDDANHPTRIIGVADGNGGLLRQTGDFTTNISKVVSAINTQKVQPNL